MPRSETGRNTVNIAGKHIWHKPRSPSRRAGVASRKRTRMRAARVIGEDSPFRLTSNSYRLNGVSVHFPSRDMLALLSQCDRARRPTMLGQTRRAFQCVLDLDLEPAFPQSAVAAAGARYSSSARTRGCGNDTCSLPRTAVQVAPGVFLGEDYRLPGIAGWTRCWGPQQREDEIGVPGKEISRLIQRSPLTPAK